MNKTQAKKSTSNRTIIILVVILLLTICLGSYVTKIPDSLWYKNYNKIPDEFKDSELFEDMQSGASFCFLGDSITHGSAINGIAWYEPIKPYILGNISNMSYSGWSSLDLIEHADEIPESDIYVVAIGVNDVEFIERACGATSPEEFADNLQTLSEIIFEISPNAKIYFITPWAMMENDEYLQIRQNYGDALMNWCDGVNTIGIDPYPFTMDVLRRDGPERYMHDTFHPNAERGIGLFSYAVLYQEHLRRIS